MNAHEAKKLTEAIDILTDYLMDNTEEVFEELPEIDEVRSILLELMN